MSSKNRLKWWEVTTLSWGFTIYSSMLCWFVVSSEARFLLDGMLCFLCYFHWVCYHVATLQVCQGDGKGVLCRRCCVVPGLTHPEATAATGQKKMSHCLTRPVELVWQRHALYCVVDYCLGRAVVTLQVCLGDEKGALCRRCCVVPGLTHPEATAATGQK